MNKIEELEKKTANISAELAELKKVRQEVEPEWPKVGDAYWLVDADGDSDVDVSIWDDDEYDHARMSIGNVFQTEEHSLGGSRKRPAIMTPLDKLEAQADMAAHGDYIMVLDPAQIKAMIALIRQMGALLDIARWREQNELSGCHELYDAALAALEQFGKEGS